MAKLTIFFDFVCPFCIVGWEKLKQLVPAEAWPDEIVWHPMILDATVPPSGIPFLKYHGDKYGDRSLPLQRHVEALGRELGLDFDFANLKTYPLTIDAHKLVKFAAAQGRASEVAIAVIKAYFLGNREIQDHSVLIAIAEEHGLDPNEAKAALLARDLEPVILEETRQARSWGVPHVPAYALNGRIVGGTEELIAALRQRLHATA
jgi:predicted DsbA family dithiol-disulfide isomerase